MTAYILSQEARNDLREIKSYIAADNLEAARRMIAEFRRAFRALARMPGMGHTRLDVTARPLRFWPVGSYLIIYQPRTRPLEIVAVLHGRRNVARILSERR